MEKKEGIKRISFFQGFQYSSLTISFSREIKPNLLQAIEIHELFSALQINKQGKGNEGICGVNSLYTV
jgi:hypothetical protein